MNAEAERILANLKSVDDERRRRADVPGLAERVRAVKAYQHRRFAHTYADLLDVPRYAEATRFFLDDLYGPHDFTDRDAQFARVVPALVRLFPGNVVHTVRLLSQLHALSERLDSGMATALPTEEIDARAYQRAWRATGERGDRLRQIELMLEIGHALDRYTSSLLLGRTLRMMRGPARAAGLSSLQKFLESGFDAFKAMKGASGFLSTIEQRERALVDRLFADEPVAAGEFPAAG
jgi:hypothetical protein